MHEGESFCNPAWNLRLSAGVKYLSLLTLTSCSQTFQLKTRRLEIYVRKRSAITSCLGIVRLSKHSLILSLPLICYLCLLETLFICRLFPCFCFSISCIFFFSSRVSFLSHSYAFCPLLVFYFTPFLSSVPLPTSFSSPASSSSSFGPIEVEPNGGTPRRRPLSFCPCCAHEGNVTSHAPCSPWPQLGCHRSTSQLVTTGSPAFYCCFPKPAFSVATW